MARGLSPDRFDPNGGKGTRTQIQDTQAHTVEIQREKRPRVLDRFAYYVSDIELVELGLFFIVHFAFTNGISCLESLLISLDAYPSSALCFLAHRSNVAFGRVDGSTELSDGRTVEYRLRAGRNLGPVLLLFSRHVFRTLLASTDTEIQPFCCHFCWNPQHPDSRSCG
ncbi:hypothetical protein GQ53DRAFT_93832 [Thozetella sp. PMI_491]|nr:hypothetical protein GQ53DRAFT_93832 [Thozetella sp. PMI_491]